MSEFKTTTRIRGVLWKVIFKAIPPAWRGKGKPRQPMMGWCHLDDRKIEIDYRLQPAALLETAIHEFTHGFFPDLGEEAVTDYGLELSQFLWDLGFRRAEV